MAYRRKTLRQMHPVSRKYAKLVNDLDCLIRRAKNLLNEIQTIENQSQALDMQLKETANKQDKNALLQHEDIFNTL